MLNEAVSLQIIQYEEWGSLATTVWRRHK